MLEYRKIDDTIGLIIRRLRELEDCSQAEFARRLSLTPSALCQIEKGKRINNLDTLQRIAGAFKMNLSDLIAEAERSTDEILAENAQIMKKMFS